MRERNKSINPMSFVGLSTIFQKSSSPWMLALFIQWLNWLKRLQKQCELSVEVKAVYCKSPKFKKNFLILWSNWLMIISWFQFLLTNIDSKSTPEPCCDNKNFSSFLSFCQTIQIWFFLLPHWIVWISKNMFLENRSLFPCYKISPSQT